MEEYLLRELDLRTAAVEVPVDVKMRIVDMGYYNDVMKGYMILGMRNAGFTESEIRKAVLGMRRALDEKTAEEAEKVYTGEENE